jgi:hypothetical protein
MDGQSDSLGPEEFLRSGLTPEVLEWARQGINEEEISAALREIRETGGLTLDQFIHEIEELALPKE